MKKLTKFKKEWRQVGIVLLSLICLGGFGSCVDGNSDVSVPTYYPSDPGQPVTFSDFTPTEGTLRTRMFIRGTNFGTDTSLINVIIGGQKAKVITSTGTEIYCMVPARACGGNVEVEIRNAENAESVKYTFEQTFTYQYNTSVGTLCGKEDADGKHTIADGTFEEAGFGSLRMMLFDDRERDIYVVEGDAASNMQLRKIDLDAKTVSTTLKTGAVNWGGRIYSSAWSADKDTIFMNSLHNNEESTGVYYFLRKENFAIGHDCVIGKQIRCVFTHPTEAGLLFYYRQDDSKLYRAMFNPDNGLWESMALTTFVQSGQNIESCMFHPTGKYVYCLTKEGRNIAKADFDINTKTFSVPSVFVGQHGSSGFQDGVGNSARFVCPTQGCFVLNEEYVRAGKEDVYDFYVVDCDNHCVRTVTPTGVVTLYAGRGSVSTDGKVYGYIDGDLRETARFKWPFGICYDSSDGTFYISDKDNYRIRTIAVQ